MYYILARYACLFYVKYQYQDATPRSPLATAKVQKPDIMTPKTSRGAPPRSRQKIQFKKLGVFESGKTHGEIDYCF